MPGQNKAEETPAATKFLTLARGYCSLVDTRSNLQREELVRQAWRMISELYGAAIDLPENQPSDSRGTPNGISKEEWSILFHSLRDQLQDYDSFWEGNPKGGESSLADDFADIYRDLRRGLALWQAERHADAVWEWRFGFQSHWGDHALNALRAIHGIERGAHIDKLGHDA